MKRKTFLSYSGALGVAAALLTGCGGGSTGFPQEISYQNLKGQTKGEVLGAGMSLSDAGLTNCAAGKVWCLSSLTMLGSHEQFQAHIAQLPDQQPGAMEAKQQVLAYGAGVDFSKNQVWSLKLGGADVASVGLKINELASAIEIQAVVCYETPIASQRFLTNVFAVVPRETSVKPFVYLDKLGSFYGPECPLALNR